MKELNFDFCVTALSSAIVSGRAALQTELAVGLFVYHEYGVVDLAAKKGLRGVYAACGEDCATAEGADYKTNSRRMDRIGKLFDKIGSRKIKKALVGLKDMEAVEALRVFIEPLGLKNMETVSEYCREPGESKPVGAVAERTRRATDKPGLVHVKTAHCDVVVPPEADEQELIELARRLMELAASLHKETV